MGQIPIKITTNETSSNRSPRPANGHTGAPVRSKKRVLFWLLLILIIIEAGIIAYLYISNTTPAYYSLIPKNSISVIYFNQSSLRDLIGGRPDWAPLISAEQIFSDFLNKNGLSADEITSILEDKMALVWLPAAGQDSPPEWLFLATLNKSPAEASSIIEKAEKSLKQNFNLNSETYRQIEITQIEPLSQSYSGFYFAQPENLFILSNDDQTIKSTVDKALK